MFCGLMILNNFALQRVNKAVWFQNFLIWNKDQFYCLIQILFYDSVAQKRKGCDMAFIEHMHSNKSNITYLLREGKPEK